MKIYNQLKNKANLQSVIKPNKGKITLPECIYRLYKEKTSHNKTSTQPTFKWTWG